MDPNDSQSDNSIETPAEKTERLLAPLRGRFKDEIASFGGAEQFMRWIRSDDEEWRSQVEMQAQERLRARTVQE